jgi:hypothetical protein
MPNDNTTLYHADLARWGEATAALVRAARFHEIDLEALAEELEGLGTGDDRRLWAHLRELLVWFLSWNYAPDQRMQHAWWYVRVVNERVAMKVILDVSPSLRSVLTEDLPTCYASAREIAAEETGLATQTFPEACPWTANQIVHSCFWPMGDHELSTRPLLVPPDAIEDGPGDGATLATLYAQARQDAARQMGTPPEALPETCPWTIEQILDHDFYPGEAP